MISPGQPPDPFDLQRFVDAQAGHYDRALRELSEGRKQTHWMWFVFPQLAGLGHSAMARRYALGSREEVRTYYAHEVLGPRLVRACRAAVAVPHASARDVFGSPDDLKLQACATLFALVIPGDSTFQDVLHRYFDGAPHVATERLLVNAPSR